MGSAGGSSQSVPPAPPPTPTLVDDSVLQARQEEKRKQALAYGRAAMKTFQGGDMLLGGPALSMGGGNGA